MRVEVELTNTELWEELQPLYEFRGDLRIDIDAAFQFLSRIDRLMFYPLEGGHWRISVICNDMFYFASADAEPVESPAELMELMSYCRESPDWGVVKWLCHRRQMQPCYRCYIHPMQEDGVWDESMAALPLGPQSSPD